MLFVRVSVGDCRCRTNAAGKVGGRCTKLEMLSRLLGCAELWAVFGDHMLPKAHESFAAFHAAGADYRSRWSVGELAYKSCMQRI